MTGSTLPVVLRSVGVVSTSPARVAEPISIGIPLPRGLVLDPNALSLERIAGEPIALQARTLDSWPDGSIRWVLLDFLGDSVDGVFEVRLRERNRATSGPASSLRISVEGELRIDTGAASFRFPLGGAFPLPAVSVGDQAVAYQSELRLAGGGRDIAVRLHSAVVTEAGPVRISVAVTGTIESEPLRITGRVDLYAGSAVARIAITAHNPRRAEHRGGQWGLGDPGSLFVHSLALVTTPESAFTAVRASTAFAASPAAEALPFSVLQESSGGAHWNGPVHKARDGRVPLRFRGYRCMSGGDERTGNRAWPVVVGETATGRVGAAVPRFWQNFPGAIDVTTAAITVGFFPAGAPAPYELQGGEQKTFAAVLSFDVGAHDATALGWVHEPQLVFPSPEWCCGTGAAPFLVPAALDSSDRYRDLVQLGLDPTVGFVSKRERADEYGWRHFGDIPADHESAFRPPDDPFVSHYNNQYDAIAGFALQFLRSGDRRWWDLMDDLARHVRDIDIYHTTEDKAAYNGGLFWHTAHYVDAGLSTHRTYPPGGATGGGPSAEHNYNLGLMLHAFLTGDEASRRAAIGLGRWVINMDDGRQTVFRWLASGPTGHANFTNGFYGPGRGAGHSVLACLVAHCLSGEAAYLDKAEELIERTIHTSDDPDTLELLDAERRWSYTAFLQSLGVYLFHQSERGVRNDTVEHARASLVRYARWMLAHERPYLDRPDALEYPTETWAAQDLRKGDVLLWAALVGPPEDRAALLEGARRYFAYALSTLWQMPTRHFTRPLVIVLSHGVRHGWLLADADPPALYDDATLRFDATRHPKVHFEPQRTIAVRRARWLAGGALIAVVAFLLALYIAW